MHVRLPIAPLIVVILLGIPLREGRAADPPANRKQDESAIRKAAAQYVEALKRGDARALAVAWTADGDYLDANGTASKARDLISKQFPAGAAAQQTREMAIRTSSIRFITADVAIEDGISEVRSNDEEEAAPGRYTAVWVKQGGRWLLDGVREAPAAVAESPEVSPPADSRLTQLAWLVGDWTASAGKMTYQVSAKFLEQDRVLERKFTVRTDDHVVVEGTQYITRDPQTGEITSHAIDSSGGYAEGFWSRDDGNSWTVETTGALADGKATESTNVYLLHDDGTVTWSVLDSKVAGQDVPDLCVKFSRRPAK